MARVVRKLSMLAGCLAAVPTVFVAAERRFTSRALCLVIHTVPASTRLATSHARSASADQTDAPKLSSEPAIWANTSSRLL